MRLNETELAQVDPGSEPGMREGQVRRGDQYYPFAGTGQPCKGGPEQTQFADAGGGDQQLAQCRVRPAASGQGSVQGGMAGRLVTGRDDAWLAAP